MEFIREDCIYANTTSMFKNCDMLKTLIGSDSKILEVFRDR